MRVIKKYNNRKLYDTKESKYVTLIQIEQILKNGEEIKVIKHKENKDITKQILLDIFSSTSRLSSTDLYELIKSKENN